MCAQSEENEIPLPSRIIKMNPWEFIDNTFFIEVEKFNQQSNESWNFGLGLKSGYDWYGGNELGAKLELAKRFYIKGLSAHVPKKDRSPYLVGVFAGFYLRGAYTYKEQEESLWDDGLQDYIEETNERAVYSVFPGVLLGVTRTFWDILFIEGYVGGGVRYAFYEDSNPDFNNYDEVYYDLAEEEYRGVAPNIGMKVGVAF